MARTDVPVQQSVANSQALISWTAGDSTNDHEFTNDGYTELLVWGNGSGCSVTIKATADELGRAVDLVQAVSNGDVRRFGPFRKFGWNQTNGKVNVDLDVSTNIKVAAVRMPVP